MLNMSYPTKLYPFRFRRLNSDSVVAVSNSGDHIFLDNQQLDKLVNERDSLSIELIAELKSKFFLGTSIGNTGSTRLLASRIAAKNETVLSGPSLHILVPTLQCAHSCRYCQVSRALDSAGYSMSQDDLTNSCTTIFESPAQTLTVEFQGGDPLIRFDLVKRAIELINQINQREKRSIRFIVTSTLHQLDEEMCAFFKANNVYLSTSIDGPASLHDLNRPLPGRDSYARTVAGIKLAQRAIGPDSVSALVTVTRASLEFPNEVVDEYVNLGFQEIFLRPLSHYGFAVRNAHAINYSELEFAAFYERAWNRIINLNQQGVAIREVSASIVLNKILSPFDSGYVDLQSPCGAGLSTLVYNYDGYVYPSDESRMLAEMGNTGLRLGRIGSSMSQLLNSEVQRKLIRASLVDYVPGCNQCAYNRFCGPDPVNAYGKFGDTQAPVHLTDHCQRFTWLFDFLFKKLNKADKEFMDLAYTWAGVMEHRENRYA